MFKIRFHTFGLQVPCKPNAESSLFAEVKPGLGPNLAAKVIQFFGIHKHFYGFFFACSDFCAKFAVESIQNT